MGPLSISIYILIVSYILYTQIRIRVDNKYRRPNEFTDKKKMCISIVIGIAFMFLIGSAIGTIFLIYFEFNLQTVINIDMLITLILAFSYNELIEYFVRNGIAKKLWAKNA